jgi:hypothetical protein
MHPTFTKQSVQTRKKRKIRNIESYRMGPSRFVFGHSLYRNTGRAPFEEVSDSMGVENYWPWGPSVGELNADVWEGIFMASSMNFPFR